MKLFLIVLLVAMPGLIANAKMAPQSKTATQEICDSFETEYDIECAHIMCNDLIKDGTFKDLSDGESASDYAEAAQATCEGIPEVADKVDDYNEAHSGTKITCE